MSVTVDLTEDLDTCLALRREVFIEEQGVPVDEEVDGLDPECLHLLAWADGVAVGTARILMQGDTAKIGRVCITRPQRGTGLGKLLIEKALEVSHGKAKVAKLGAQLDALRFYEKLGFEAVGDVFDDAGIQHRMMVRPL